MSTRRISSRSSVPPKYAAVSPTGTPTARTRAAAASPTLIDTRAPYMSRLNSSRRRGAAAAAREAPSGEESTVAHLRVQGRVGEIDEDVHRNDHHAKQERQRQQHRVIAPGRGGHEVPADAGDPGDRFDEERSGDD